MRRWLVLAAGLAVALGCVRLGVWQLRRLGERRALGASIQDRQRRPPVDLEILARHVAAPGAAGSGDRAPASSDTVAYRRAAGQGRFDFSRQIVVVSRALEGIPGVWVVTPLVLPGGAAILTERGWAPSPDAYRVALDSLGEPEAQRVEGVLLAVRSARPLPAGSGWPLYLPADDPRAVAARFPYPLLPWVLRRTAAGAGAPERLRPLPLPLPGSGPHLSYAIQWFAFAAIALGGSVLLFRREAARPGAPAGGDRSPAAGQPGGPGGS